MMLLIGHRGARGEAPENTLAGFRYLRRLGIRAVELDIRLAGDGSLVVIHDDSLARTTLSDGLTSRMSATELAAVDALHRRFPDWPGQEGVPTLAAVMKELADFTHIQFEVKPASPEECRLIAERFVPLWRESGFGERAFTTCFNPLYLQAVRELAPEIPRGFLIEQDFAGDAVAMASALGCRSLGPHQARCTPALVSAAQAAGLIVSTWTVNDPARMDELAAIGVDSLITDVPALALRERPALFRP